LDIIEKTMKKLTIKEAVIEALKKKGTPLTARDIYDAIIEQNLYQFKSPSPVNIIKVEIRRQCEGVELPKAKTNKVFQMFGDNKYWLKGIPVNKK
jgi:hypothetical protein